MKKVRLWNTGVTYHNTALKCLPCREILCQFDCQIFICLKSAFSLNGYHTPWKHPRGNNSYFALGPAKSLDFLYDRYPLFYYNTCMFLISSTILCATMHYNLIKPSHCKSFHDMFRPKWSSSGVKICGWWNWCPYALMLSCRYMIPQVRTSGTTYQQLSSFLTHNFYRLMTTTSAETCRENFKVTSFY
jgi:hypothetical protein